MRTDNLTVLYRQGVIRELDLHFAGFMAMLAEDGDPDLSLAAALVSSASGRGDICLDLSAAAQRTIFKGPDGKGAVVCPSLEVWRSKLESSPVVGRPGDKFPLILDGKDRLYLYRYWDYEKTVADFMLQRARQEIAPIDFSMLKDGLKRLFPEGSPDAVNWQKVAALTALLKNICIISGGPGTGKTFAVARILVLLAEQFHRAGCQVLLAAPTGKAASRLAESIKRAKTRLNCNEALTNVIPQEALTIHRMLQFRSRSPRYGFNRENPLPADAVIIDEASMIDLALMYKLVQALPQRTKLVLIGDKNQLASVEAGAVLGDICDRNTTHGFSLNYCKQIRELAGECICPQGDHGKPGSGLHDCLVNLTGSHRFDPESDIGELSAAVNQGDGHKTFDLLNNRRKPDTSFVPIQSRDHFYQLIRDEMGTGYTEYLQTQDPHRALILFERFKVLCALRVGPYGVDSVNRLVEQVLIQKNLIQRNGGYHNPWYAGRPVLITSNDYNLGLFNGDIGITLSDPNSHRNDLWVFFPDASGELKRFSPYILPAHETVHAMTVHKSQGSEFENVILILPERDSPLLTRELIYTAITRARNRVKVLGNEMVLKSSISRQIQRRSGLRDALWGDWPVNSDHPL